MNLEIILVRTVLVLTAALSVGISLWGGYYLLTGLMSWRRPMDYGRHPAGTRFAVLIAARNEELVIGPLINSLLEQEYPAELYDIYVIPNNCTDNTALAARQFGAEVLECTVPVRSKGEVLRFAEEQLSGRHYDAFCVFDADNVVDRCFLKEMNNAYRAGARAAQGYRELVLTGIEISSWESRTGAVRHDQRHRLHGGRLYSEEAGGLADGDHQRGPGDDRPVRAGGRAGGLGAAGRHL